MLTLAPRLPCLQAEVQALMAEDLEDLKREYYALLHGGEISHEADHGADQLELPPAPAAIYQTDGHADMLFRRRDCFRFNQKLCFQPGTSQLLAIACLTPAPLQPIMIFVHCHVCQVTHTTTSLIVVLMPWFNDSSLRCSCSYKTTHLPSP